jgi:hypothetical protein
VNGYKIAIYVDAAGKPSHAAKQTGDGAWSSKIGDWEDIEHKLLSSLEDKPDTRSAYGKSAHYMKRPRKAPAATAAPSAVESAAEPLPPSEATATAEPPETQPPPA